MSFTGLHSCLFAPHLRTTGISPPGRRPARTQYASHQPASSFQAANNQYASYQLASRLACSLEPYRGSLTCPVSRRWSDRPLLLVLCWWSEQLLPPGFSLVLCQCFCLNTWCILTIPQEHVDMMYISMETAIALASVLGNVLVVLVVCVNRALRNTTFCFIVSLAVADIAVGVLVIPLAIVISLRFNTQFYTCLFLSCLLLIITQSSILSLLAIAIDRYLRVKIPTRYNTIVTQRRAYVAVCLCWILSFLTGLVPMIGWNNRDAQGNISISSEIICEFTTVMRMDYMVYFNFFGWVVVPLSIMIALYGEIFRVIRRQLNRRAEATCDGDGDRYYRKELKLAKSLALVVFLFAVCWLPIHIMNCINFFCPKCYVPKFAMYVGIFMSHVNSALNPMVYAFRIKPFRVTLIKITHRCMLCKPTEPTMCPTSTPGLTEKVGGNL